jgi:menaquinone-dependent protoporphyrinogen oxidase
MPSVQVVCASRHGATAGIAGRIAEVLTSEGIQVLAADAADRPRLADVDGYVIGSGVYLGSWLKDGVRFLEEHASDLSRRPVWLFSSGPLPGSSKTVADADPLDAALGPAEGPGSGGHKKIAALSATIQPREHRVFLGAFDPKAPAKSMPERVLRLLPRSDSILPAGDWREWDAIEAWARSIARALEESAVPVG